MNKGDLVVCIDDKIDRPDIHDKIFKNWIKENETYTVREVSGNLTGGKSILLEEVINPAIFIPELQGKAEPRFKIERFQKMLSVEVKEVKHEKAEI